MLNFRADAFFQAASGIKEMSAWIRADWTDDDPTFKRDEGIEQRDREFLVPRIRNLIAHLDLLEAEVTLLSAKDLADHMEKTDVKWEHVLSGLENIELTLLRELSLIRFISLSRTDKSYYEPKKPLFGQTFEDRFKSASFELDEAAKCLALGRSTACVFHLMRLMEIGITAIARCLSIPDPLRPAERNWGHILKAVSAGIDTKWPTAADRLSGDGALFEALYVSLDAVKNPWRNATMHVENKYTDDEAEHILMAVKGFMKKMASRMDEMGEPKA